MFWLSGKRAILWGCFSLNKHVYFSHNAPEGKINPPNLPGTENEALVHLVSETGAWHVEDATHVHYEEFSYAVESDGFLSILFFFFLVFLAWQGLHTQHRIQGEASSSSGDVTSTMMLTPTSIPTTWSHHNTQTTWSLKRNSARILPLWSSCHLITW